MKKAPPPSQTSKILKDFPANIPASKNHRRSDNPCVQSRLMVRFGKNRMEKLPCEKKMSKALQKYMQKSREPEKNKKTKKNYSVCFESQSALYLGLAKIHKSVG